jgi:hypothetical protein
MNPIQTLRHEVRTNVVMVVMALAGEPGLTIEQQQERLAVAAEAVATAAAAVEKAQALLAERKEAQALLATVEVQTEA